MTTPFIAHPCAPRRRLLQSLCASACALAWPALAQQRSADAKAAILIGRSSALSGPMAPFLTPVHEGQEAALADFNEAGGVAGREVQLVSLDDKFDAALALDNARRLVQDSGVVALFG